MIEARFKKRITTGNGPVVLDINLSLGSGEFTSLFGASGAGKTTILRILAGLTNPDEGRIVVDEQVWFDSACKINIPPQRRSVGFVFQEYNLFPNMTLKENLQFALDSSQDISLIDEFLEIAGLIEVQNFKPSMLSGGQKQRAALMRALIRNPKILLLDEPFSALDLPMRWALQEEVLKIYERFKIPTLMVSHDVADVKRLSKRIFVLQDGLIKEDDLAQYAIVTANGV
ncbi:MAG: ATP-binding cassette domain-containing protein [Candidatus Omnitrophota bacterium]